MSKRKPKSDPKVSFARLAQRDAPMWMILPSPSIMMLPLWRSLIWMR